MQRRNRALLLMGLSLAAHDVMAAGTETTPKAAPPAKTLHPDPKFLEYLGTAEDDEDNWLDVELSVNESKAATDAPASKPAKQPMPAVEKK